MSEVPDWLREAWVTQHEKCVSFLVNELHWNAQQIASAFVEPMPAIERAQYLSALGLSHLSIGHVLGRSGTAIDRLLSPEKRQLHLDANRRRRITPPVPHEPQS